MTRAAGGSSPAERVLAACFHEAIWCPENLGFIEAVGARDVEWVDRLPEIAGELEIVYGNAVHRRGSWRFGNYCVTAYYCWGFRINGQGRGSWVPADLSPYRMVLERIPGPWRELPPAPPQPELVEEDYSPL